MAGGIDLLPDVGNAAHHAGRRLVVDHTDGFDEMAAVVRELRDELRSDARIDLRGPGFDWILVRVRTRADVERALELLRRAARATRTIAP